MTKYNKNLIIIQELSYNYTRIMKFTTTTEIARKGSKIFQEYSEAIVLNNNKNIGVIVGWELAQALLDSWFLDELKENLDMYSNKKKLVKEFEESSKSGLSDLVI